MDIVFGLIFDFDELYELLDVLFWIVNEFVDIIFVGIIIEM